MSEPPIRQVEGDCRAIEVQRLGPVLSIWQNAQTGLTLPFLAVAVHNGRMQPVTIVRTARKPGDA